MVATSLTAPSARFDLSVAEAPSVRGQRAGLVMAFGAAARSTARARGRAGRRGGVVLEPRREEPAQQISRFMLHTSSVCSWARE